MDNPVKKGVSRHKLARTVFIIILEVRADVKEISE